jgi:IstB-like ATP binding protein
MAEGNASQPGCAPPNCVSRRASKMSTIAPPEVSTAPCSRSSRRATGSTPTTIWPWSVRPASARAGWPAPLPVATIGPSSIIAGQSSARTWRSPEATAAIRASSNPSAAPILLILDDFGLEPLDAGARHDLLEILEERHGRRSTVVTSQLPLVTWHEVIGDPTYADAILNRLVHNAHRIELTGESLRRTRGKQSKTA